MIRQLGWGTRSLACGFLVCFLWGISVGAQNTADIVGTVTDTSGAVIAAASVRLTNTGTGISRITQTGTTGDYAFALVEVGTYTVTVEAKGFKRFVAPSITIAAGD